MNKNKKNPLCKILIIVCVIILAIILTFGGIIFGLKSYVDYISNKKLEAQEVVVMNYLNSKYQGYDFEIVSTKETCDPYTVFECKDIYLNVVLVKPQNIEFEVEVSKSELSIWYDEFDEVQNRLTEE